MTAGDDVLCFTYDANGHPESVTFNGDLFYYITNLQGDVTWITNSIGRAVVSYNYDAWGNLVATDAMNDELQELNPLRYRGYVYDNETGLYYLQSRYYNPEMGRFLNSDALVSTGEGIIGFNMFTYCNNSVMNYTDPTGRDLISLSALALFGVVALVCTAIAIFGDSYSVIQQNTQADFEQSNPNKQKKKPTNLPSWKKLQIDVDHITSGHMPDGPRNPDENKTVFWGLTLNQVINAIHDAYDHSSKVATIGDRIKLIGFSNKFELTIEIWLNIAELIIETAYPKG